MAFFLSITLSLVVSTIIDMNHCPIGETQETEIEHADTSAGKACLYKWVSCLSNCLSFVLIFHSP